MGIGGSGVGGGLRLTPRDASHQICQDCLNQTDGPEATSHCASRMTRRLGLSLLEAGCSSTRSPFWPQGQGVPFTLSPSCARGTEKTGTE